MAPIHLTSFVFYAELQKRGRDGGDEPVQSHELEFNVLIARVPSFWQAPTGLGAHSTHRIIKEGTSFSGGCASLSLIWFPSSARSMLQAPEVHATTTTLGGNWFECEHMSQTRLHCNLIETRFFFLLSVLFF